MIAMMFDVSHFGLARTWAYWVLQDCVEVKLITVGGRVFI
jgi:hypothetical protein